MSISPTYFAAELESRKAVEEVIKRIRRFRSHTRDTGRAFRMVRSWRTLYGYGPDGTGETSATRASGQQGELVEMATNDYAALLKQAAVMTTATRPAFKSIAKTTDFTAHAQAILSDGLQEYYERTKALGTLDRNAVVTALCASEAWQVQAWDFEAGQPVAAQDGRALREGDIRFHVLTPFDVAYDPDVKSDADGVWFAFKTPQRRHDLAALLLKRGRAEEAKRLLAASTAEFDVDPDSRQFDQRTRGSSVDRDVDRDTVDVWEFRHLATESVPKGRLIQFVTADTILHDTVASDETGAVVDSGFPYAELHAYRLAPETVIGGNVAHTPFFDLLSGQEGLDAVATIQASAVNAGGISNLWCPPGELPEVVALAGGLNIIQAAVEPKPVLSVKVDPGALQFADSVLNYMRRRIGFNAAALGEPQKGMPAQAMALMQAQAVQFHSDLQEAYSRFVERTRTGLLKMLQRFASTKRVATIAGKSNSWTLKEFDSKDLEHVDRVSLEQVNPATRMFSGRMELLDWLGQRNLISDAKQAIAFLDTGRIETVYEFDSLNLARIRREKEMLMQGIGLPPPVPPGMPPPPGTFIRPLLSDTHWLDIPEYLSVLAAPEARENPAVVNAVLTVVQEKVRLWRSMDPALLAVLKGPPCPPPAPIMPPVPGVQLPPGAGPQPANGGPPEPSQAKAPLPEGAKPVNLPKPPPMREPASGAPVQMPGVAPAA